MAETEVVSPPPLRTPATESDSLAGREDAPAERRDGKPERSRRDEDIPDMTVEEAHKALNALPKPEPQPDTEEHDAKVAAINDGIKKIKDEIEVIRVKIDEAQEARRGQGDEMDEARSVMRSLKEERDEIRSQLSTIQEESVRAKAALEGHDKTKRQLQAHLKFRTVPEIEEAIRKMEIRQQTSSMSLAEEKKLVKEIEQLKQSKKTAAQYVTQEEAVGKAKDGYGAARKTESEKKAELRAVSEKLKAAHTALEEMNKTRDEEGGEVSALYEERKAKQEMIKEKIEEIKELRGAHRAKLDNWKRLLRRKTELLPMTKSLRALASKIQLWAGTKGFAESNQLHMLDAVQLIYLAWGDVTQKTIARHNQRRERSKLRRALGKAEYLSRQEAKNARAKALEEEEAKKIPYESEMVLCDTLVAYLETTFLRSEAPSVPKTNGAVELSKNIAFTEFDGKKMVMKKRSDEEYIVGAGKKRGGARRKGGGKGNAGGQKGSKGSAIVHAIDTMESFSLLSIPPPPNRAAVPDAIKALKEKRTWYSEQPRGTIPSKNKGDKPKPAGSKKEIAPEITDEAFPSLPGTLNPKPLAVAEALNGDLEASKPAGEDGDAGDEASPKSEENGEGEKETAEEEANGEEDAADTGEGLSKGVEKEQVEPAVTAASIVANGVNGSASKGKINEAPASPEATEAAAEGEGEGAGAGAEVSGVKDEEEGEGEGGDGEDGAGATAEEGGEEGEEEERGEPECDAEPAAEGTGNGDAGDATGEDDGAEDVEVKKSEEVQVVDGEGAANEDGDDGEETNDTPPPSMAPVAEPLEAAKPSSSAEKDQEGGEECGANDAASKDVEEEG